MPRERSELDPEPAGQGTHVFDDIGRPSVRDSSVRVQARLSRTLVQMSTRVGSASAKASAALFGHARSVRSGAPRQCDRRPPVTAANGDVC